MCDVICCDRFSESNNAQFLAPIFRFKYDWNPDVRLWTPENPRSELNRVQIISETFLTWRQYDMRETVKNAVNGTASMNPHGLLKASTGTDGTRIELNRTSIVWVVRGRQCWGILVLSSLNHKLGDAGVMPLSAGSEIPDPSVVP